MAGEHSETPRGADHYGIVWRLTAAGWLTCAVLQFLLYLRPSPYGGPLLADWKTFIVRPLVYELLSTWLVALPFLLVLLWLYRRPLPSPRWRIAHWVLAGLMTVNILLTQFDHELYRFIGLRLGPNFLAIYAEPTTMGDVLFLNILANDQGGPYLSLILCLAAPILYAAWAAIMIRRRGRAWPRLRFGARTAIALLVIPLAIGQAGYSLAHAKFRLSRLEPALFAIVRDFYWKYEDDKAPGDPAQLARAWQSEWLAASADKGWRFPGVERPFLRVPLRASTPAPADRWNVVLIQLETVRGIDTGHLRPDRKPSPTPYLDTLAAGPNAAVWTRALSFGPPSVNGRFALQCSITPSSRRFITSQTHIALYCLPDALRKQGYRAETFSAGDIDMDNSTIWVQGMYDKLWRYPELGQDDRAIFRRATERIRTLGRQGPFIATLISASNHHPFRSREPGLDIAPLDTVQQRILNTTRYTDDVVREVIEGLRSEPWFDRTLFVINSDHGYNLGEHGGLIGSYSLFRESTWVPFLIVGRHPRLPAGRRDNVATLLDVAPTVADLIGLREPNPWQGHSLLSVSPERPIRFGFRDSLTAEAGGWSAVSDPQQGRPLLYRTREDWLQREDLSKKHRALAKKLLDEADRDRRFNDYAIRHGKVWPRNKGAQGR